jgi:hypothetical protein
MPKPFLQSVAPVIGAARVEFDMLEFVLGGRVVTEGIDEFVSDIDLEEQNYEDGWDGGNPEE